MQEVNRDAQLVQVILTGMATHKRKNRLTGGTEYRLVWKGDKGELHDVWFPEAQVKLLPKDGN